MRNLILITVLVVAAAAWAVLDRDGATVDATASGPFLPELQGAVNDVGRMTIRAGEERFTVARDEDGWVLTDWGDYPAAFETVKGVVTGLADMEIRTRMTGLPERHANLGLQDPSAEGATSVGVRLEDDGGRVLADLVVGKARDGRPAGVYVRHADDDQTWLVSGSVAPPRDAAGWVDKQLVRVAADRVASVTVVHPDGEVVRVQRPAPAVADAEGDDETDDDGEVDGEPSDPFADLGADDAPEWELADLPEGYTVRSAYALSGLAGGLARFDMQRLASDDDTLPADDAWTRVTVATSDGLEIALSLASADDGTSWFARLEPSAADDAEAGVADELAELGSRVAGRTFVVPSWRATTFTKRLADLADPPPEPEPEPAEGLPLAPEFLPDGEVVAPVEESGPDSLDAAVDAAAAGTDDAPAADDAPAEESPPAQGDADAEESTPPADGDADSDEGP